MWAEVASAELNLDGILWPEFYIFAILNMWKLLADILYMSKYVSNKLFENRLARSNCFISTNYRVFWFAEWLWEMNKVECARKCASSEIVKKKIHKLKEGGETCQHICPRGVYMSLKKFSPQTQSWQAWTGMWGWKCWMSAAENEDNFLVRPSL